jgi:serine protease Do
MLILNNISHLFHKLYTISCYTLFKQLRKGNKKEERSIAMAEFDNGNPNNNPEYYQNTNNQNGSNQNFNNPNTNNAMNQNGNYQNANMYNQNPNRQIPEYSFWAEQMPGRNDQYNASNPNSRGYGNNPNPGNQGMNYQNGSNQSMYNQSMYNQNINNQGMNYQGMNYQNMNYQNMSYQNAQTSKKKKEQKQHKVWGFIGKALCFGLIAGLVFVGISQLVYAINPNSAAYMSKMEGDSKDEKKYEIGYTSRGTVKTVESSAISSIIDKTMPAIVAINCTATQPYDWFGQQFSQEVEGSGSGFIVGKDEKELLIATNNHVVEGATKIVVTFIDDSTAEAVVKGTDATADLAVLSIDISNMEQDTLDKILIAKLGDSDQVKVGEMAIAIGNSLGYGQSVTIGYISAKDREVELQSSSYNTWKMVLLQTDAAINPGNSGGALLNVNGEVIGINTVKFASNEVEGMGYAIPISKATSIINELMTREIIAEEEQGYLGISGTDVTEDVASYYNLPIGVFIKELAKGGAAEKGGLLPNDIITKIDDIEITSISQLREYVTSKRVGTKVTVTYMRKTGNEYKEDTKIITLGKNPNITKK